MKIISNEKKEDVSTEEKIRSIGFTFAVSGLLGFPILFFIPKGPNKTIFTYFIISHAAISITTGLGAYYFKKWGYYLLLISASLMSLGFPIGFYGIKLYRFLKLPEVKSLFGVKSAKSTY